MKNAIIISIILWGSNIKLFITLFSTNTFYESLYEIIIYYVIILFLLILFSFNRILNTIFTNTLFIISIFGVYFITTMGIVIDGNMLNNILSTNMLEASELFNIFFLGYLLIAFGLLYLINRYLLLRAKNMKVKEYFITLGFILILAFGLFKIDRDSLDKFMATDTPTVSPLFIIPSIGEYINLADRLEEIHKKNISSEYELNLDSKTIVVFILGESARGDRFGINGYARNTTPKLASIKNLVSLQDATSCHTSTLNSVPCLMTRIVKNNYDIRIDETSFVQIYSDLGYDTYWYSRHSNQKRVNTFCEEAQICEYLNETTYDESLIQKVVDIKDSSQSSLIVLHTLGSHLQYNVRVPPAYQYFQPLCNGNVSGCKKNTLDNSYDNTILYTDKFISQVIEVLKDKNACIIYTSDHGESLGEDSLGLVRRYGHSTPYIIAPKEQKEIPLILWFSDKYLQNNKNINIDKLSKIEKTSHDNIFDTVLGCGGITNKSIRGEVLNLLNK